jgi:hypothetical protein
LKLGLQKLCSTLANVNLCEAAEDENRSSIINNPDQQSIQLSSTEFNSTMISGRSHLNELQKENRAPSSSSISSSNRSSPSILSNTMPTVNNYQI